VRWWPATSAGSARISTGPALDRAVDAAFDSYARYWIESFRLPNLSPAEVDAGFSFEGYDPVARAREAGQGVIIALPHLGGWEWAAFWLAEIENVPITAVVEPVEPPELFEWFVEFRRSLGMNVVPLGPRAGAEALQAVRSGEILCLLCDRDIGGGGVEVEFFGERTTLPPGPATLALRTGAPLIPTAIYFDGDGHRAVVEPPLDIERTGGLRHDVARVTQDLAHALERLISAAPEQWHLMQPNWPSDYENPV
jgi:phosphatidylinositol dimannoside acyltransferase